MSRPYVYKLIHRETKEFYIGVRYANKQPASEDLGYSYFSSSKIIKQKGFDNFECIILKEFDTPSQALEFESQLITEYWGDVLLLNLHNKGAKFKNNSPRPDWLKERLSFLNKGIKKGPLSEEHKSKISKSNKGKTISAGRKRLSDETKQRMSISRKNSSDTTKFGNPAFNKNCPYCDANVNPGTFGRYHGERCKSYSSKK